MNLTTILCIQNERSGEQLNNINEIVANSLIFVVENFLLQLATSFVLTLSYRRTHTSNFYNDLLERLFKQWDAPPMQIVNINGHMNLHVPGRRHFNLLFVDSYESFRSIDVISYTAQYNYNEYYYIFLQTQDHLAPTEMQRVFEYCWSHHIIHCTVQVQNANGEILMYTYFPFLWNECGKVTPKLINQFNGTALLNPTLFPKKLSNFHGCALRVATWNVPPFMYLEYLSDGTGRIVGGIEGRLLQELSLKLNFTVKVKVPPNNEQRGVLKGNNVTGALLMLKEYAVDLSLGSFRTAADRESITSTTVSYYQTMQVICLPLKTYELSSLEILLLPFAWSTWLFFLAIWIACSAVVFFLKLGQRRFLSLFRNNFPSHYCLNVFKLTVGMAVTNTPERDSGRLLCINWILFTLIIRSAYQAMLFHLIRTQLTKHVPQSFEELLLTNFTIVMNRAAYFSLDGIPFLKSLNLLMIDDVNDTIQFEYVEKNARSNLAAAGPLDFLLYYGSIHRKAGVFKILPQSVVSFPLTIYFRKHSYLIDHFNYEILCLRSMGFVDAWSRWELDYKYLGLKHRFKDNTFDLDELYMVFVMCFIGFTLAVLCFILEISSKKARILRGAFMQL